MADIIYTKVDEKTLEVVEPVKTIEKKTRYTRKYLKAQKKAIKEDKEKYVAARNAEIEFIDALLLKMDKAGIIDEKEDETEVI